MSRGLIGTADRGQRRGRRCDQKLKPGSITKDAVNPGQEIDLDPGSSETPLKGPGQA